MKRVLVLCVILVLSACSVPTPDPIVIPQKLNLENEVFVRVEYLSSPDAWQTRPLLFTESANILQSLLSRPLTFVNDDIQLKPWLKLHSDDMTYIVARTADNLFIQDQAIGAWFKSDFTDFDGLFSWIFPQFESTLGYFETLLVKGASQENYKSLQLNDENRSVIYALLSESSWRPHLHHFDQSLWFDAIITMTTQDTLYFLKDELGTLMWKVTSEGKAHGYVLDASVFENLLTDLTPYFIAQYFRNPLTEAELFSDDAEMDGVFVELDATISAQLLANVRIDEWNHAVDIPSVGVAVELILYDETFAYVFAPFNEYDLVMVRHPELQTNDYYFVPQGLARHLRRLIETYFYMLP